MSENKITDDQANEALQQVMGMTNDSEDVRVEEPAPEPPAEPEPAPAEPVAAAEVPEETPAAEPGADDLESLRKRNEELKVSGTQAEERFKARMDAQQQRYAENERIMRERVLRKSTAADRARQALQASLTEDGIDRAEVEKVIRELEGTMNPASASYTPPEPSPMATEDQQITLNNFLSEQSMTREDADEFGKWVQTEAPSAMSVPEQEVARQSLSGFLRLAHTRWQQSVHEKEKEAKRDDAVGAVRSVKRTQREAAKAASASTTAPQKSAATPPAQTDLSKLTDEDISALLRQSVEQYP